MSPAGIVEATRTGWSLADITIAMALLSGGNFFDRSRK
jgi:hypothetical protein